MDYTPIGRVRPIHRGTHDPSAAYEALDVVRRADGLASYMAKQAVPAGETLADGEYWGLLSDAGVKAVADAACVPFEAGGSVAECHPVAGYPLEVRSDIGPVQSGSGDPSPDNVRPITGWTGATLTRCGKNLLENTATTQTVNGVTFTVNADGTIKANGTATADATFVVSSPTLPAGEYIGNGCPSGGDAGSGYSMYFGLSNSFEIGSGYAINLDGETQLDRVRIIIRSGLTVSNLVFRPMIRLASDADASYEPYQGNTYAAGFGQTVYGGTLDWNTGELTVDMASVQFMPEKIDSYGSAGYSMLSAHNVQPPAVTSDIYSVCDRFKRNYGWQIDYEYYYVTNGYVYLFSNRWSTLADAQAWFTDNPTTMVYRLATPTTIQLTPQEVAALEGVNTLYSSTGDTAVAGRADMGWVTQSIMDRLAALESAALSE